MRAVLPWFTLGSIAVFACTKPAPPTGPGPKNAGAVEVAIASVTLAEDCPDNRGPAWSLPAPVTPDAGSATAPPPSDAPVASQADVASSAKRAPGSASQSGERACQQSFVQLHLRGPASGEPTRFAIKKVELLDDAGKVLGELTARAPTSWQGDHYEAWAETIAAGGELSAAYELTAPAWASYGQGPFESHDGVYTLRLTIAVGDDERTVSQQTVVSGPAVLPPGAVT